MPRFSKESYKNISEYGSFFRLCHLPKNCYNNLILILVSDVITCRSCLEGVHMSTIFVYFLQTDFVWGKIETLLKAKHKTLRFFECTGNLTKKSNNMLKVENVNLWMENRIFIQRGILKSFTLLWVPWKKNRYIYYWSSIYEMADVYV